MPRSGLIDRVLHSGEAIAAPHLLDVEVTHVPRRFVITGELTEARAREAIQDHLAMGISRYRSATFPRPDYPYASDR